MHCPKREWKLTPSGSVPLRREIRDLQANYPDQWNLYILGLEAFKANDETFELSYYEIAGTLSSNGNLESTVY